MIFIPPIHAVHQHPTDLRLCVLSQDTALNFTILKSETIQAVDWQITFAIIGESHFVSIVHAGQMVLREILACADIPQESCIHNYHFIAGSDHKYDYSPSGYQVEVTFHATESPCIPAEHQIQVAFPEIWGRIPITQIGWQQAGQMLRWWTLHTYPHQTGVTSVSTASSFVLANTQDEGN